MKKKIAQLNQRIEIRKAIDTPNNNGGFDRNYITLLTVWGGIIPLRKMRYIRGEQIEVTDTHKFPFRKSALSSLGRGFKIGFSKGFNSISDLISLKSDYFLFLRKGFVSKGRLFRVNSIMDVNEEGKYIEVYSEELEEQGTGYPE